MTFGLTLIPFTDASVGLILVVLSHVPLADKVDQRYAAAGAFVVAVGASYGRTKIVRGFLGRRHRTKDLLLDVLAAYARWRQPGIDF